MTIGKYNFYGFNFFSFFQQQQVREAKAKVKKISVQVFQLSPWWCVTLNLLRLAMAAAMPAAKQVVLLEQAFKQAPD